MDAQSKVLLLMPVFNDCSLSCFVHCSFPLQPAHENEEIILVDCNGVGHKAFINTCPQNARTIDIKKFMNIFGKINRIENEVPVLFEIADKSSDSK